MKRVLGKLLIVVWICNCALGHERSVLISTLSLKPKLPRRKDLKPYPTTCYLKYKGNEGPVLSICTDNSGQHIASDSHDRMVSIWEIETCRCIKIWELGEPVQHVAWNLVPEFPILAVVFFLLRGTEPSANNNKRKQKFYRTWANKQAKQKMPQQLSKTQATQHYNPNSSNQLPGNKKTPSTRTTSRK